VAKTMCDAQEKARLEQPLTAKEVKMVQESWSKVRAIGGESGHAVTKDIFYKHMHQNEEVAALFKGVDMNLQATKLWNMLNMAVRGLTNLGSVVPMLQESGARHVGYGCYPEHYEVVGASLLHTLGVGLGSEFTPELKAAWTKVYGVVAKTMCDAQETERSRQKAAKVKMFVRIGAVVAVVGACAFAALKKQ